MDQLLIADQRSQAVAFDWGSVNLQHGAVYRDWDDIPALESRSSCYVSETGNEGFDMVYRGYAAPLFCRYHSIVLCFCALCSTIGEWNPVDPSAAAALLRVRLLFGLSSRICCKTHIRVSTIVHLERCARISICIIFHQWMDACRLRS
jgi:hypothetical protein